MNSSQADGCRNTAWRLCLANGSGAALGSSPLAPKDGEIVFEAADGGVSWCFVRYSPRL